MPAEVELGAVNASVDGAEEILQFNVRLEGLSPMIWRRVKVRADTTRRELQGIIRLALGREGIHRFAFDMRAVQFG